MNSKQKGSLAVAHCISKLYELGYEVLLPVGDRNPYDVVFDNGKGLFKVQVKFAGMTTKGNHKAGLRITGGNQSYNYAKKYGNNAFDYLFVYTQDERCYLMKWSEVKVRNEITIDDKKYQKYKI